LALKSSKDMAQAACLAVCIHAEDPDSLSDAAAAMPSSMRSVVKKAFKDFVEICGAPYRHIADELATYL